MPENFDDYQVDDIFKPKGKKRLNSKKKGNRAELEVVHILNERFKEILSKNPSAGSFQRSVGSGNRFGQKVHLSEQSKQIFSGDITCPQGIGFRFVIENKVGYNEIDICQCFSGKCNELDKFFNQAVSDSGKCQRKALLLWKKDRKPRLAGLNFKDLILHYEKFENYMIYQNWIIVDFDELLKLPDVFFFEN